MLRIVKSLFISAYMLSVMLAGRTDARPADVPLRKSLVTPSPDSELLPRLGPRPHLRQEIFQAIQSELAQMGIPERGELQPGDLKIQSSVPALNNDMGLQVKRIGYDPMRRELVFEIWNSHEPQYLPFEVTTRRDPQSLGLSSHLAWGQAEAGDESPTGSPMKGRGVNRDRSKAAVLVKPGKPVTLVMLGENVRITTTVVPLQPGSKGQCILVRDPVTARVMTAEVVDEGLLRTSF